MTAPTGGLATTTTPNPPQQAQGAVQGAGASFFDTLNNGAKDIGNYLSNATKGLNWTHYAGMAVGGLLAWVVGNAFGGGGMLGMVISGLLFAGMVMAGRGMFSSSQQAGTPEANGRELVRSGPERQRSRDVSQNAPERDFYSFLESGAPARDALVKAREVGQGIPQTEMAQAPAPVMRQAEQGVRR